MLINIHVHCITKEVKITLVYVHGKSLFQIMFFKLFNGAEKIISPYILRTEKKQKTTRNILEQDVLNTTFLYL